MCHVLGLLIQAAMGGCQFTCRAASTRIAIAIIHRERELEGGPEDEGGGEDYVDAGSGARWRSSSMRGRRAHSTVLVLDAETALALNGAPHDKGTPLMLDEETQRIRNSGLQGGAAEDGRVVGRDEHRHCGASQSFSCAEQKAEAKSSRLAAKGPAWQVHA